MVTSLSSVTVVVAVEAVSTASKLPPLVPVIDTTVSIEPCAWTSSARTAMAGPVTELAPTGMVIVCPLDSVTTKGEPVTTWLTATVYEIAPPSTTEVVEGGDGDDRLIGVVGDRGGRGAGGVQRLERAARAAGDGHVERVGALDIEVIGAHVESRAAAGGLADRDGDGLAVAQREHHGRAGDGIAQRGGVDDRAAFGDRGRRGA